MAAVIIVLLMLATFVTWFAMPGQGRDASEWMQSKGAATAEQMVVHHRIAMDFLSPTTIGALPPGQDLSSYIAYPDWYTAKSHFVTASDGAELIITWPRDDESKGPVTATLMQRGRDFPASGKVVVGVVVRNAGGAYLQTQTDRATKIALPPAMIALAPNGVPALLSIVK